MATRSSRLTIGLVAALVAVVVLGSVGAVALSRRGHGTAGVAAPNGLAGLTSTDPTFRVGTPSSTRIGSASPSTTARSSPGSTPSQVAPPPVAATPTVASSGVPPQPGADPSTVPVGPSNNLTVQMSPSVRAHARSQDVQQALQSYFDAINQHNYSSWTQSVSRGLASHQTSVQWLQAYATTMDSSIWMQTMRDDPLQVHVMFTSQQDPDLAPTDMKVGCIHWTLTYQLAQQDGILAVGSTVDGSVVYVKC